MELLWDRRDFVTWKCFSLPWLCLVITGAPHLPSQAFPEQGSSPVTLARTRFHLKGRSEDANIKFTIY